MNRKRQARRRGSPRQQAARRLGEVGSARLPDGTELVLVEGRCPACNSPDVDLSWPLERGVKCWDCATVYWL